jgi:putative DNA primase/helicase
MAKDANVQFRLQNLPMSSIDSIVAKDYEKLGYKLSAAHAEQLEKSGISRNTAMINQIHSVNDQESMNLIGYSVTGLAFPYFNANGDPVMVDGKQYTRVRLDSPKGNCKYLCPKGIGVYVYYPKHANLKDGKYQKAGLSAVITEGEKKAIAGTIENIYAVGLPGVCSIYDGDGEKRVDFIDQITSANPERIVILMDNDIYHNKHIQRSVKRLITRIIEDTLIVSGKNREYDESTVNMLCNKLKFSLLPLDSEQTKLGIDDYIQRFGKYDYVNLVNEGIQAVGIDKRKKEITPKILFDTDLLNYPGKDKHLISTIARIAGGSVFDLIDYSPKNGWVKLDENGNWIETDKTVDAITTLLQDQLKWMQGDTKKKVEVANNMKTYLTNRSSVRKWEDMHIVQFLNGQLDLRTGVLSPAAKSKYRSVNTLGFEYDPSAECPEFIKLLEFAFSEKDSNGEWILTKYSKTKIKALRSAFRISLSSNPKVKHKLETMFILLGQSGTGKGTTLAVLSKLLGTAVGQWSLFDASNQRSFIPVVSKLVAIDSDMKGSFTGASVALINKIVSGESFNVKRNWQEYSHETVLANLWAACNTIPSGNKDEKIGIARRLCIFEYDRVPKKKDTDLKDRVLEEIAGIYNWIMAVNEVDAIHDVYVYMDENFQAMHKVAANLSNVYKWMIDDESQEGCELGTQCYTVMESYRRYQRWCSENGYNGHNKANWYADLERYGCVKKQTSKGIVITFPSTKVVLENAKN